MLYPSRQVSLNPELLFKFFLFTPRIQAEHNSAGQRKELQRQEEAQTDKYSIKSRTDVAVLTTNVSSLITQPQSVAASYLLDTKTELFKKGRESGNNVHLLDNQLSDLLFIPPCPPSPPLQRSQPSAALHLSISISPGPSHGCSLSSLLFDFPSSCRVSPLILSSVCPPCCPTLLSSPLFVPAPLYFTNDTNSIQVNREKRVCALCVIA